MPGEARERRRFRRAIFPCKIYILTAPLHVIRCNTENIGAGGVRVMIDEQITINSFVGLKLYLSQEPIKCKGKIAWVVDEVKNKKQIKFDTGIEFREISKTDQENIDIFVKSLV